MLMSMEQVALIGHQFESVSNPRQCYTKATASSMQVQTQELSLHRKADKGQYVQSEWVFTRDTETPQQTSSYDCGIFVFSYLLEAASQTQLHWDNNQIKVLRARLGCQILALDLQLDSFFEASPGQTTGQVPPQGSEYVSVTMHAPVKRQLSKTPTPVSSPEQSKIQTSSQHSPLAKFTSNQRVKKLKVAPPPFELRIPGLGYKKSSLTKAEARANELLKWIPQEENDEPDGAICPFCDDIIPEYLQEEFDSEVQPYIKLSR
ncbi:hypothetical protein FRC07_007442, partial [Ceratobasidium sp. 392]